MRKNINIEKKIEFSSMIGEVSAISLEHNLKFVSSDEIVGDLIVCGRYKATSASQIEEDFSEKIPVSISLIEKIDVETAKVDIVDFYYDVLDSSSLKCNIELLVDDLEVIDDLNDGSLDDKVRGCPLEDDRECDGDPISTKEIEIPRIENAEIVTEEINKNNEQERVEDNITDDMKKDVKEENIKIDDDVTEDNDVSIEGVEETENLFFNFDSSKETYGTFVVYIVRQNETINSIIEKYKTTVEEIEKYNDIKDISIGSKLIIPLMNEKD